MKEHEEIKRAISRLEAQRDMLGDSATEAALVGLRRRLAELEQTGTVGLASPESAVAQPPIPGRRIGERRVVTVLFCDVTGSTAMAERLDPEEWAGIMNGAFERLIEPVERFGGTVTRLLGDAVLAFFGAPVANEDDPQRAVSAALDMLDNIGPFRQGLKRDRGLDFAVRIGINTGLAVVGDVGSEMHGEYSAMGDAVNLAARMEQTAAPGTIQIAQSTYAQVAPLFECQPLGEIAVKGKSEPIAAYRVLGRKAEPGRLRGLSGHGISSPIVGRDSELAAATAAVDRLFAGEGGMLAILGEAGVGKSRLMDEMRNRIAGRDGRQATLNWLEGHTLSYSQTISYWPFQLILRSEAGITEEEGDRDAWRKLEERVSTLFPAEAAEVLPYLATLLAIDVQGDYVERVRHLDGEALGRQLYRAFRLLFRRLAVERPLALVFDDVHWMDASSTGLLEHLLPLVETVPLLFILLSRSDPESPAARLRELAVTNYGERFTEIELQPLSTDNTRQLIENLLHIDSLPGHIRQMIVDKADGNPFYLEEIVRDLIEAGALVHDPASSRWQATPAAERVTVPDTIQGLIMARIDRLDEHLKRVATRAAVIGRAFLFRLLESVLDEDRALEERLNRLVQVELIREKQRFPEHEYIFKHALVQEAAYDSVLLQERRKLHQRVGAAIESLFPDRLDEFYALLAHHYTAAENWDKAQDYLFKAGDQAGRMAADTEALAHYRQAMDAYARARGDDWAPLERARLERKIGEALYRLGRHGQARPYLERALALLGAPVPSSPWTTRLAIARALLTQLAHRLLPRLFVKPMGGGLDPHAQEIFESSTILAGVELLANVERLLLLSLRSLNSSERLGYAYGAAVQAAGLGAAATLIGRLGLARTYFRQCETYAQLTMPYRPVPELEIAYAAYYNLLSDFEKMEEHALSGTEIAGSAGFLRQWGIAKVSLVWSHWGRADYRAAVREAKELLQAAEDSSDQQLAGWGLLAYGCVQLRRGQAQDAVATFRKGYEIARELPDYVTLAGIGGWMGRSYLRLGKLEQAMELMESTERLLVGKFYNMSAYAYLGNGLAEAYLAAAKHCYAEERQSWLQKTHPILRRTVKEAVRNRMTLADALLLRGRYEWLSGKPKGARKSWARALDQAKAVGQRYEEGAIHFEIGRTMGDREHLQRAASIFEEIGAELDLAAARRALEA